MTMRSQIVRLFEQAISPWIDSIHSVAVIGGGRDEPELKSLSKLLDQEVKVLGIDPYSDFYIDLNYPIDKPLPKFDLVLCSQVFEHIWNIHEAIINIHKVLNGGGLLWLACPASNRAHGSPEFYSAGYQPQMLSNLASIYGFETMQMGRIGSERCYFMTHGLSVWPSDEEHDRPIVFYDFSRLPGPKWKNALRFLRDLPGRILAITKSSKLSEDIRYATETFLLLQKKPTY
ncbi:MAG: class I SAM-dependent methyltransferase [Actinobacteria bacterium]|nr:class I SAM-dependent methyltransferase [Actinomycetota bacterium]